MRCIVGISGGDLKSNNYLNEYAIEKTGKKNPNVLFVPTASMDASPYIENIIDYYGEKECDVDILYLCNPSKNKVSLEEKIEWADLIYIGGGNTEYMVSLWKKQQIDKLLYQAYVNGKVMTGISAGLICWFAYGHSDSDYFVNSDNWEYKFVEALNYFPYIICPHYNEEGRDSFDSMLRKASLAYSGIALDNDIALIIEDDCIRILKADDNRKAYLFLHQDGSYKKIELENGSNIE